MELGINSLHWSNYYPTEYRVLVKRESIKNTDILNIYSWKCALFPEIDLDHYVCVFKRKQKATLLVQELEENKILCYRNWF